MVKSCSWVTLSVTDQLLFYFFQYTSVGCICTAAEITVIIQIQKSSCIFSKIVSQNSCKMPMRTALDFAFLVVYCCYKKKRLTWTMKFDQ